MKMSVVLFKNDIHHKYSFVLIHYTTVPLYHCTNAVSSHVSSSGIKVGWGENEKLAYGDSKFGFTLEQVKEVIEYSASLGLVVDTLHVHCGWGLQVTVNVYCNYNCTVHKHHHKHIIALKYSLII